MSPILPDPPEPGPPQQPEVSDYLGEHSWTSDVVKSALRAESAAQRAVCNVPDDDADWPSDLREALCRRVMHNLALRGLPLGLESSMTEAAVSTTRVGGTDAEVKRLEAPHRKRKCA